MHNHEKTPPSDGVKIRLQGSECPGDNPKRISDVSEANGRAHNGSERAHLSDSAAGGSYL